MFSFIKRFIPFTREYKERKRKTDIGQLIKELEIVKDGFNNAIDYNEVFIPFEKALNNPLLSDFDVTRIDKYTKVSLMGKTSQKVLYLIDNRLYDFDTLKRQSDYISLIERDINFVDWYSGDEQFSLLYSLLVDIVRKKNLLARTQSWDAVSTSDEPINTRHYEDPEVILDEERIFATSLLFKVACIDITTLLLVYLESCNEKTEQENNY